MKNNGFPERIRINDLIYHFLRIHEFDENLAYYDHESEDFPIISIMDANKLKIL